MDMLKVVAVASSEAVRTTLYNQLKALPWLSFDGVSLELSDAARAFQQNAPDILIVDLSGREADGGLFMQTLTMDLDYHATIIVLHHTLDPQTILDAVQNGAKEFIQYPQDFEKLTRALQKYWTMIYRRNGSEAEKSHQYGKLITTFSAKGGVGCSTVALNTAYELNLLLTNDSDDAKTDSRVALLDLDQVFCNTAAMLNLTPSYSMGDLTNTDPDDLDEQILQRVIAHHESGLHLVVGSKSVLDDHELISPELLDKTISFLTAHYQYVIVDLPTHVLDPYHQYMIERSDLVLMVSTLEVPALARARQYLDLAKKYLDMDKIKLIINRWDQKAAYGMENQTVEDSFAYPVSMRLPNDWEINVESSSLGAPFGQIKRNNNLVKAYQTLARQIIGTEEPVTEEASHGENGILARFMTGIHHPKKGQKADVLR